MLGYFKHFEWKYHYNNLGKNNKGKARKGGTQGRLAPSASKYVLWKCEIYSLI